MCAFNSNDLAASLEIVMAQIPAIRQFWAKKLWGLEREESSQNWERPTTESKVQHDLSQFFNSLYSSLEDVLSELVVSLEVMALGHHSANGNCYLPSLCCKILEYLWKYQIVSKCYPGQLFGQQMEHMFVQHPGNWAGVRLHPMSQLGSLVFPCDYEPPSCFWQDTKSCGPDRHLVTEFPIMEKLHLKSFRSEIWISP